MPRVAPPIQLDVKARRDLQAMLRSPRTRPRLKVRCRIILLSAQELLNRDIAERLGLPQVTVGKWRRAFAQKGLDGLRDAPRPGRPPKYDRRFTRRLAREMKQARHRSLRSLAHKMGVPPSTLHDLVKSMSLGPVVPAAKKKRGSRAHA